MKSDPRIDAELSWSQVHAFRLAGHHLAARAPRRDLVKVTGDIGGAQAQVMSAAELQLAARSEVMVSDVRHALWKERTLVKTWLMRGTLHLVPARDLPVYTAAMRGQSMQVRQSWLNYFELTRADLEKLVDSIGASMNGQPMTRTEIAAAVGRGQSERVREWLKSGWGGLLKPAARAGLLCFGPSRGQSVTFVRPQDWLGAWRDVEPGPALAEVARRYLHAFGPATRQDFRFWWGHWPGVAGAAWDLLEGELATVTVGGRRAQMLISDLERLPTAARGSVQLLPLFDPYLMGYESRDHLLEPVHRAKVTRTAGWISAVLLVDGLVEGTWTHSLSRGVLRVSLVPFRKLPPGVLSKATHRARELAKSMGATSAELKLA